MKNRTNISGVIEGKPEYSLKNTNDNEMKRNNNYSNQPSFMNNNNNFNNNPPLLLNPYTNSIQSSYNYNNKNIGNSIPEPFGNN